MNSRIRCLLSLPVWCQLVWWNLSQQWEALGHMQRFMRESRKVSIWRQVCNRIYLISDHGQSWNPTRSLVPTAPVALLEVGSHCLLMDSYPGLCLSTWPLMIAIARHPRCWLPPAWPASYLPLQLPLPHFRSVWPLDLGQVHSQQTVQVYVSIPNTSFFCFLLHFPSNLLMLDLYYF